MSNPHNAHYYNKIKTLENTIQQLEGRIRILTAGKQPEPTIEEQIAELAEIHGTSDIELLYTCNPTDPLHGSWFIKIHWWKKDGNLKHYNSCLAPTLDEVLDNAKTLTKG
jgi:hypothetical protein